MKRPALRKIVAAAGLVVAAVVVAAGPVAAHPLGNFTVNTSSGLVVHPAGVDLRFVLDMAEIPSFQTRTDIDANHDGRTDGAELASFRASECDQMRQNVELRFQDRPLLLAVRSAVLSFPPGQAGLTTLRLVCELHADADVSGGGAFSFTSANFVDRTGWREITTEGDGLVLSGAGLRTTSISEELTRYPKNLLQAPLDERAVSFTAAPGGPRLARTGTTARGPSSPLPRGVDRATKAFTSFVARQHLTIGFAIVAMALSALLGAIHAFAPGHGKTVMAAYLVGQQGTLRQAGFIALTVTMTHTLGVLVLGVAISASALVAPERLYPYLGLASGLMLAAIGVGLLRRSWRGRERPLPDHPHDDGHAAGDDHLHEHGHGLTHDGGHGGSSPATHTHGGRAHRHGPAVPGAPVTVASMLAIGFVGGFLPSPSAVVVILGAIALHRAWFGIVLVLAYGVGMALTLTGAGLLLLRTRGALDRRFLTGSRRGRLMAFNRMLPALTGTVIVIVGLVLSAQGLVKV
jgi:ABC-type nickel/cobalt efflux system permease component RcnA